MMIKNSRRQMLSLALCAAAAGAAGPGWAQAWPTKPITSSSPIPPVATPMRWPGCSPRSSRPRSASRWWWTTAPAPAASSAAASLPRRRRRLHAAGRAQHLLDRADRAQDRRRRRLRRGERLHAHHPDRDDAAVPGLRARQRRQEPEGHGGRRPAQPRPVLRQPRQRLADAHPRRDVQQVGRPEHQACAVQGRRAGDQRRARRPRAADRGHLRPDRALPAERQGHAAGGGRQGPLAARAQRADPGGAGLQGRRGGGLERHLRVPRACRPRS